MLRAILYSSCAGAVLLLTLTSCHAQTLSNCQPAPPLRPNVKPGVAGLTLSHDGNTLVVGGGDGKLRFVDMTTGQVRRALTGHTNVVYRGVFNSNEKLLGTSSRDQTARVWDVATGRELQKLGGFRCPVKAVVFSPDSRVVAASGNDGRVKLYDVKTGKELKSLVHINSADIDMAAYSLAFGRDGTKIYAGNGDATISEWDVASGKETRVWKAHDNMTFKLVFSPDYSLLASFGDSVVKLWDTSNWREIRSMSMGRAAAPFTLSGDLAYSHNGELVAASDVGLDQKQTSYVYVQAVVWNVKTGEKLFTVEGHKFDINGLVFTKDDRFLVTGSVDTTIKFWDMKTGLEARAFTIPGDTH